MLLHSNLSPGADDYKWNLVEWLEQTGILGTIFSFPCSFFPKSTFRFCFSFIIQLPSSESTPLINHVLNEKSGGTVIHSKMPQEKATRFSAVNKNTLNILDWERLWCWRVCLVKKIFNPSAHRTSNLLNDQVSCFSFLHLINRSGHPTLMCRCMSRTLIYLKDNEITKDSPGRKRTKLWFFARNNSSGRVRITFHFAA